MEKVLYYCTYCKRPVEEYVAGINTGLPYCPDKHIETCNKSFGRNAGFLEVKDWKAIEVRTSA